ncbi:uncharacterized protein K441DRAFT_586579, partial [Cenococcum geophilum 1.58]|uniref:uncharacterized protein n=1 Tax=Cenococcum geophilum 1.58 TaxID=794803 RepID=UPI00358FD607
YSLTAIKLGFKAAFRSNLKIFNLLINNTRVVVIMTTTKELQPYLFCNYNRGKRPKKISK